MYRTTLLSTLLVFSLIPTTSWSQDVTATAEPGQTPTNEAIRPTADDADSIAPDAVGEESAVDILEDAAPEDFGKRQHDQIWLISSRGVYSPHASSTNLSYCQRIEGDQWRDESFESFTSPAHDGRPRRTLIYIHGNRTTSEEALTDGLAVYDQTFLQWEDASPVRFVIWTWPSDRIGGEIKDVRTKACYAEQHAFHLARLLTQMREHQQVAIIGYSFGGRLAINALHLVGGGSVHGYGLETQDRSIPPVNLTLMAPAIRNDCFCNTKWMGLSKINHLFILYNSKDIYLQFYRLAKFDENHDALGFTGMPCRRRGYLNSNQIEQFNAATRVGRDHSYLSYIVDKRVEQIVRRNIFKEDFNLRDLGGSDVQ
jgi:hypothetical protein